MKIVKKFQIKIVIFTVVKNRCILHGRVFVMCFLVCVSEFDILYSFELTLFYILLRENDFLLFGTKY